MKKLFLIPIAWVFLCALVPTAPALAAERVKTVIDLSEQRMYLYVNGRRTNSWAVSTARKGFRTPTGNYRPTRLERMWHSRKYHWSPMPYSIFFLGGYAIHGTNDLKRLGSPASHGCVRLHPKNAAKLFALVKRAGPGNTSIVIRR